MRIAISSQNFRTITGHAGKSRRFIVYEQTAAGDFQEIERLDLPKELSLHEYHGDDHPLYRLGLTAILTASAGAGFLQRMGRAGIRVIATSETDIEAALAAIAAQRPLAAAAPHDHDHDHEHEHDEDADQTDAPSVSLADQLRVAHGHGGGCCGHAHGDSAGHGRRHGHC